MIYIDLFQNEPDYSSSRPTSNGPRVTFWHSTVDGYKCIVPCSARNRNVTGEQITADVGIYMQREEVQDHGYWELNAPTPDREKAEHEAFATQHSDDLPSTHRPVTRGGSGGSDEPPFSRTPLQIMRTPPPLPQTFRQHIWHRIPRMSNSSESTPIQLTWPAIEASSKRSPNPLQHSIRSSKIGKIAWTSQKSQTRCCWRTA